MELPDELVRYIREFVPPVWIYNTCRAHYEAYHRHVTTARLESCLREVIRRDMEYVFERVVREKIDRWLELRQYRYKNMKFNGYIHFVMYFCMESNAERCREWLIKYLESRQLCKNLYKKNVVRYIKWNCLI